jgi:cobalt-zinc-cadmium efflux system protein
VGVILNGLFVLIEAVFGIRTHSMSLLADAGHNVGDVAGLIIAWTATVMTTRPPTPTRTYGLRGSSILAALTNSALLLIAVGAIGFEAIRRLWAPEMVQGGTVALVACGGILVNGASALMFLAGSKEDLNIRAAFTHLASDAIMALAVAIGGVFITLTRQPLIDPILSLAIVLLILVGTWRLFKESLGFALQGVPPGVNIEEVRQCLQSLKGVEAVHDLHVWGMSTTEPALTAHLVAPSVKDTDGLIRIASAALNDSFKIHHVTLQIEKDPACAADCEGPV